MSRRFILWSLLLTFLTPALAADDPLASRILIVYIANSPDSVAVKDHYVAARFSVPASAKVCPLTLPDIEATGYLEAEYNTLIRNPIRNCLTAVGRTNILYIVMAYVRPQAIGVPNIFGNASIDSYLSDIWDQYSATTFYQAPTAPHRYFAERQNQGNVYQPFVSLADYRAQPRSTLLYSVWRLDGPTPAIAMGLVDKAIAAANNATGAACIDRNRGDYNLLQDTGAASADIDLHKAGTFLAQAGITVVEDTADAEFGFPGAPAKCPADGSPVAFYSGWYSLNRYNGPGVFSWAPGAVGFHIDSASALDPRGGLNWTANALAEGITVTSGSMNEPYLSGLARPAGLFRNLLEGANVGDAFLRNTQWVKWMILNFGDPLYRPFPVGGKSPFNPPPPQNSFAIANRILVGGGIAAGTITLDTPAGAGGVLVNLTSDNTAIGPVQPSVTVPQGQRSASFPVNTGVVTDPISLAITASTGLVTMKNSINAYPWLAGIGLSQKNVTGGATVTCGVFLNASAPAGGLSVSLESTDPTVATVPATIVVPAGLGRVEFPLATVPVALIKSTEIKATYAGATVTVVLTANP